MNVGFLTRPFAQASAAELAAVAGDARAPVLELTAGRGTGLDLAEPRDASLRAIEELRARGLEIASLAVYELVTGGAATDDQTARANVLAAIELAAASGVPAVSTLAGFPVENDRERTITAVLPEALEPAVEQAGELGIRLAFENWFRTNLRDLEHWQLFFEVFPAAHVGLVFDPSHLEWQRIDWRAALQSHAERIVFVHAKDVAYDHARLARVGVLGAGWWRYVLPGLGVLAWQEVVDQLSAVGYDGPLIIEHEDTAYGSAEGIALAARHLGAVLEEAVAA